MEECIGYNGEDSDGDNTLMRTASIIYCDKHCPNIFSVPYNSDEEFQFPALQFQWGRCYFSSCFIHEKTDM